MSFNITTVNLSSLDLNLLVVLDAVLIEGSATRAAARLHVTQSAVSNALARLRRILDDPLVLRTRRGLTPTARALALRSQLRDGLSQLQRVVEPAMPFDLRASRRQWSLAFAEHHGPVVLPPLMARLRKDAPNASLRVITLDAMSASQLLENGEVDLHIGIPGTLPSGWRAETLYEDDPVGIARRGHPRVRQRLSIERFVELPQIQLRVTSNRGREVDDVLAARGFTRQVMLTVPHLSSVFAVVAETDCIAVVGRRQAELHAARHALRIFEVPLKLPRLKVGMHWHARADRDESVIVLRKMLRECLG